MAIALIATLVACSPEPRAPLSVTDWCWLHYRLAPAEALSSDTGPPSKDAAPAWLDWLTATADAPGVRRVVHDRQRQLVEGFASTGSWSDAERAAYITEANTEPTPATVCETVGARIAPDRGDGVLPDDWQLRFLDPDDPAYSELAAASEEPS